MATAQSKHTAEDGTRPGGDVMQEQGQQSDRAIAEVQEAHQEILQQIEMHETEAEKLKDALTQMGFDYEAHRQREDEEDERAETPKRARNQGRRRRQGGDGRGRVTSPDDGRLKQNSTGRQEAARRDGDDGRGEVRDRNDGRLKGNR